MIVGTTCKKKRRLKAFHIRKSLDRERAWRAVRVLIHQLGDTSRFSERKEMLSLISIGICCFTISRRSLLSSLGFVASSTKMEAKRETMRILIHGGDNMLGRAVQLTFPVQAAGEDLIKDSCTAAHYSDLCLNHPSGRENDLSLDEIRDLNAQNGSYLWGDYQGLLITPPPDLRLLNIETAVTKSIHNQDLPMWKGIRYHMHSDNYETAMQGFRQETHGGECPSPVVANFANNHAMDYGRQALEQESIPLFKHLQSDGFQTIGVGMDIHEAATPAKLNCKSTDVQVFAFSAGCSGTPTDWWATENRSGLVGLPSLYSSKDVDSALRIVRAVFERSPKPATGLRIVSIHWGPNWAMKGESVEEVAARRKFAHKLVDEYAVDLIYGHSSHHARGMEVYENKLMYVFPSLLYLCHLKIALHLHHCSMLVFMVQVTLLTIMRDLRIAERRSTTG